MSFAAKMIMMLIARVKSMGFLEWAGIASLADTILTYDVKQQMFQLVCEYAAKGAGLNLNKDDPFSDASLSGAVSERLGFAVRSLKDPVMMREDVENYAAALVSERSGYQITSVTNVAALKSDLERISMQILSERVGIPIALAGGDMSPAAVREQVLVWAKAELMTRVGEGAAIAAQDIVTAGGLDAVAADLNSRLAAAGSVESITSRQLAVRIAEKMAVVAVADFGRVAVWVARDNRRREQNRLAQQKFRRIHGNRSKYIPIAQSGGAAPPGVI